MSKKNSRTHPGTNRELTEAAIRMALEGQWEKAERLNRILLEQNPDNVDALNRLGKALMELGEYRDAYITYGRALELDPYNRISLKNYKRLENLLQRGESRIKPEISACERVLPDLFISESGKSAVVPVYSAVDQVIDQPKRGDPVRLESSGETVLVRSLDNVILGRLDPRISHRLSQFIQKGNRYAAAIAEVEPSGIKVFVREIYQDPQQAGRLSFPPMHLSQTGSVRPYNSNWDLHLQEALERGSEDEEEEEEEIVNGMHLEGDENQVDDEDQEFDEALEEM